MRASARGRVWQRGAVRCGTSFSGGGSTRRRASRSGLRTRAATHNAKAAPHPIGGRKGAHIARTRERGTQQFVRRPHNRSARESRCLTRCCMRPRTDHATHARHACEPVALTQNDCHRCEQHASSRARSPAASRRARARTRLRSYTNVRAHSGQGLVFDRTVRGLRCYGQSVPTDRWQGPEASARKRHARIHHFLPSATPHSAPAVTLQLP